MSFVNLPNLNGEILPSFPCHPITKSPFTAHGFMDATTAIDKFHNSTRNQEFVYGVPTGSATGFDVLDIDPEAFPWEKEQNFPETRAHKTPRDGTHYFFKTNPAVRNSTSKIAPGVDVRAGGGYVIWWPSSGLLFFNREIVPWPQNLLDLALQGNEKTQANTKVVTLGWTKIFGSSQFTVDECFANLAPDLHDNEAIKEIYFSLFAQGKPGVTTFSLGGVTGIRKYSRESKFAIRAAHNSMIRISATSPGSRNETLNAEAFALGRLLARGWTFPRNIIRALWRGAVSCNLVRDDGPYKSINTIVSGLSAGLENPYPDLEDKKEGF